MADNLCFDEELRALEALLDDLEDTKEEIDPQEERPEIMKNDEDDSQNDVLELLKKVREKISKKYTTVVDAQNALQSLMQQVQKINDALMDMAKCSREYANGEIDEKLRCERIQNIMEDIRIPVKELQLQMGRPCDKEGPITEGELRDFRDYVEGFITALRDHIKSLGGTVPASESKMKDDDEKDVETENLDIDSDENDDVKEKKREAMEFTKVCESLTIDTSVEENDLASALESLLNDITEL